MKLFVGPKEVLVNFEQSQVIERVKESEVSTAARAFFNDLSETGFDIGRNTKVDDEIESAEGSGIKPGEAKVHLVELVPRIRERSFKLLFLHLFFNEIAQI